MSKKNNTTLLIGWIQGLPFWMFLFIKVAGTSLSAWSYWWLLLPIIPCLAFVFNKMNWTI
jgi:hypothetical protein